MGPQTRVHHATQVELTAFVSGGQESVDGGIREERGVWCGVHGGLWGVKGGMVVRG